MIRGSGFYEQLFFYNKETMLLLDPSTGKIVDCNQEACNFYGYTRPEMLALYITDINILPLELIKAEMEQARQENRNFFYFRHRLKNGDIRDVDVRSNPVIIEGQDYLLSVIVDTTEARKENQKAKKEKEYLERLVIERTYEIEKERLNLLRNKNRLQTAQKMGHIGDFEIDIKTGRIMSSSDEFLAIFGFKGGDKLTVNSLRKQVFKEQRHIPLEAFTSLARGKQKMDVQFQLRKADDKSLRFVRVRAERADGGEMIHGVIQDITDLKKTEEDLKQREELFRTIFDQSPFGIVLVDSDTGVIYEANQKYQDIVGRSIEKNTILDWMSITHPDDIQADQDNMDKMNSGEIDGYSMDKRYLRPDGSIVWISMTIVPIKLRGKGRRQHITLIEDISERKKYIEDITYASEHDSLTGLYNRKFLDSEFDRRIGGEKSPVAYIIGDINGLKLYNDTFGQYEGDREIIRIGTRIKEFIGADDILARIGGDEFGIIVRGHDENYVEQLTEALEDYVNFSDNRRKNNALTISFGYSVERTNNRTMDDLHREAEAFMYSKKYYNKRSSRSNVIDVVMNTLFEKSVRERNHSDRVGRICETIGRKMGFDERRVNRLKVAGFFHDIGKIGIDERILNKNGKLEEHEWDMMKLHTVKGARILENTMEYRDIADIVLYHHERYDGKGYPKGLRGEIIPLEARIITVADAYDAMTEKRTYRDIFSHKEAVDELERCAGRQFDPEIVEAFVSCFKDELPLMNELEN